MQQSFATPLPIHLGFWGLHTIVACSQSYLAVVIWCDVLGGVFLGENPLSQSGPIHSRQESGERRETAPRKCKDIH